VIIDYGMGNLRSVEKAFAFLGHMAVVSEDPSTLRDASGIVLPGVGSFGDAMHELNNRKLIPPILDMLDVGKPFLGICLGYQLLFESSEESPGITGLGVLSGNVLRFPPEVKIPHMGWNDVTFTCPHPILDGVGNGSYFYFVHSYYVKPSQKELTLAMTDYGSTFSSGVARENLVAFQFHPEKSSSLGLRILENFASMCVQ
jgi:imidazole glycerol-phosphate synthase subunit HisH